MASQTRTEEVLNSLTHGLALVASLVGFPALVVAAASRHDAWQVVGVSVFATSLVALYAASTVYHALPLSRAKRMLRVLDHCAIYLLIAGTYTPFTLGALRGPWGWTLLGLVWGLAAFGIVFKAVGGFRFPRLSTAAYLGMGWLCLPAIPRLWMAIPPAGLALMVAGGILYSAGVVFYASRRWRFSHAVWHLFVAAGSACHFFAVLWYSSGRPA